MQVFQNKAAKVILDRALYSFAMHALANLKRIPLETNSKNNMIIWDFQVSKGIGANNGLYFMLSKILISLARQSDNLWI